MDCWFSVNSYLCLAFRYFDVRYAFWNVGLDSATPPFAWFCTLKQRQYQPLLLQMSYTDFWGVDYPTLYPLSVCCVVVIHKCWKIEVIILDHSRTVAMPGVTLLLYIFGTRKALGIDHHHPTSKVLVKSWVKTQWMYRTGSFRINFGSAKNSSLQLLIRTCCLNWDACLLKMWNLRAFQ